jgi:hypothetical protein
MPIPTPLGGGATVIRRPSEARRGMRTPVKATAELPMMSPPSSFEELEYYPSPSIRSRPSQGSLAAAEMRVGSQLKSKNSQSSVASSYRPHLERGLQPKPSVSSFDSHLTGSFDPIPHVVSVKPTPPPKPLISQRSPTPPPRSTLRAQAPPTPVRPIITATSTPSETSSTYSSNTSFSPLPVPARTTLFFPNTPSPERNSIPHLQTLSSFEKKLEKDKEGGRKSVYTERTVRPGEKDSRRSTYKPISGHVAPITSPRVVEPPTPPPTVALPTPTPTIRDFRATLLSKSTRPSPTSHSETLITLTFGYTLDDPTKNTDVILPLERLQRAGGELLRFVESHLEGGGDRGSGVSSVEKIQPEMTDGSSAEESDLDSDEYGLSALLR